MSTKPCLILVKFYLKPLKNDTFVVKRQCRHVPYFAFRKLFSLPLLPFMF